MMKTIPLHTEADFKSMRLAGRLAAEVLDYITPHVVPGVTTEELDKLCYDFIIAAKAIPACLGYRGFPKSIWCVMESLVLKSSYREIF